MRRSGWISSSNPAPKYDLVSVRATSDSAEVPRSKSILDTLVLGTLFGLWYLFNIYFNIYNKQVAISFYFLFSFLHRTVIYCHLLLCQLWSHVGLAFALLIISFSCTGRFCPVIVIPGSKLKSHQARHEFSCIVKRLYLFLKMEFTNQYGLWIKRKGNGTCKLYRLREMKMKRKSNQCLTFDCKSMQH